MVIHKLVQSGELNAYQIAIMHLIASYSNGCWLSVPGFCKKLRISKNTFFKHIKVLTENKLVLVKKRNGTRNYFWLNSKEHQEWWLKQTKQTSTKSGTGDMDDQYQIRDTGIPN